MKSQLEIVVEQPSAHRVQMTLRGELDAHSVRFLDAALNELIVDAPVWIVVDLSEVGYVSSSGVMRLIAARDEAQKVGGDVALAGAQPQVFQLLGLEEMLRFASGVTEAWHAMAKAS